MVTKIYPLSPRRLTESRRSDLHCVPYTALPSPSFSLFNVHSFNFLVTFDINWNVSSVEFLNGKKDTQSEPPWDTLSLIQEVFFYSLAHSGLYK